VNWNIAMWPGRRRQVNLANPMIAPTRIIERVKAAIRERERYSSQLIESRLGQAEVHYCGFADASTWLHTLLALAKFWLVPAQAAGSGIWNSSKVRHHSFSGREVVLE
jgi:IS5 family transposase